MAWNQPERSTGLCPGGISSTAANSHAARLVIKLGLRPEDVE
jgi:hypothetical protein